MIDLTAYHRLDPQGNTLSVSAEQASLFAKREAGDFNPLHDPDNKRFCVPGDLLFALLLKHYGVSSHMRVVFDGMLDADESVHMPDSDADTVAITDQRGKPVLTLHRSGELTRDTRLCDSLTQAYVQFSGMTFPDILVDLMRDADAMINPQRPMVIYRDMSIALSRLDVGPVSLALSDTALEHNGRKGTVTLHFDLLADGESVGTGTKHMVLSGLRAFDAEAMQAVVDEYAQRKSAFNA